MINAFLLDIYLEMELLGHRWCHVQIWYFNKFSRVHQLHYQQNTTVPVVP